MHQAPFTKHQAPRRGMAVVLVLGLMAVTLAVSYATLRGQASTNQLARNNTRALDARAAASSGLAAALRKMSEDGWSGVNTPLAANITNSCWYEVSFVTGDSKLTPGDAKYGEYPFRVTVTATGYASDPANSAVRATHQSKCVVQLVRRAILAEPANFNTLKDSTLYQWGNNHCLVQFPLRVNGSSTILGTVYLCPEYPSHNNARDLYLEDLHDRIAAGKPDCRPFASPLTLARSRQDGSTESLLTSKLGLTILDTTASTANPLSHPGAVATYRLFPGGKEYTIPSLQGLYGSTLQNVTLGPDPASNPLGVFRSDGALAIQDNVTITGTIITAGSSPEIQVAGANVVLQSANLPLLANSAQVYQLPTALVADSLKIHSGSTSQLKGFTMVWNEFELRQSTSSTTFALTGNLATSKFTTRGRSSWVLNSTAWGLWKMWFDWNLNDLGNPDRQSFFPDYMQFWGNYTVQPTLTFSPASSGVLPHWQDWTQPVYQKAAGDLGLRWEVVRWEDEP